MSRQNKTANQYTVCTLGLSRQRKRIWWIGLWTVAWWSQTRYHCIRHYPGPWTSNRQFICHSFCPTSKGEGDSLSKIMTQQNSLCRLKGVFANCSTHFLELINPGQRLPIKCSSNSVLVWYNLHVAGSATATVTTYPELPPLSSSHFVARSGSLVFLTASTQTRVPADMYITTLACSPIYIRLNSVHSRLMVGT